MKSIASAVVGQLLGEDWRDRAKLEACAFVDDDSFKFFRDGRLIGSLRLWPKTAGEYYLSCMAVERMYQNSGVGHAMLGFVFDALPDAQVLSLHSEAHSFYHRIGGQRKGFEFRIRRSDFRPAKLKFREIGMDLAKTYASKPVDFIHKRFDRGGH